MFSNGTEYEIFIANNCDKCPHFVYWEEATEENPLCSVEEKIVEAMYDDEAFPYEWLDRNGSGNYCCRKKQGLGTK